MKFDTPATTNPIDQLKVVGQADRPHRRPAQDHRHRALCLRAARRRGQPGLRLRRRRRRSPRAGSPSMDLARAKAAPGVLAIVTAENAGKLGKGKLNTAKLLGGPEIQHYHQAIARRRRRDLRAGARRRAAGPRRLRPRQRARSTSPRRRTRRKPADSDRRARRYRGRRFRRRVRRGAGPARRDLHARPTSRTR